MLPTSDTPLSYHIMNDDKYNTFFADCVGALDGTHIDVSCGPEDQPRYRNRKGHLSQNVLAACNFEMEFTYILAGWEGSAHDGAVYRSAQYQHGFITPPGKYWLGDAGYPNSDTILVPYRGTRYHLKEQRLAGKKPENSKELFNLRHASKRNVIERIFGVVKRKYQILRTPVRVLDGNSNPYYSSLLHDSQLRSIYRGREGRHVARYGNTTSNTRYSTRSSLP